MTGCPQRAIDTGETSTSLYAENNTVLDENNTVLLEKAINDTEENSSTIKLANSTDCSSHTNQQRNLIRKWYICPRKNYKIITRMR